MSALRSGPCVSPFTSVFDIPRKITAMFPWESVCQNVAPPCTMCSASFSYLCFKLLCPFASTTAYSELLPYLYTQVLHYSGQTTLAWQCSSLDSSSKLSEMPSSTLTLPTLIPRRVSSAKQVSGATLVTLTILEKHCSGGAFLLSHAASLMAGSPFSVPLWCIFYSATFLVCLYLRGKPANILNGPSTRPRLPFSSPGSGIRTPCLLSKITLPQFQ